ncbi:YciI family protein [Mumia sp. DW29H23]|uniref:YciI family protein n=1 Tax=Mumia sp. DW29H23 TaxID=3421241 RepID=UPI003D696DD6
MLYTLFIHNADPREAGISQEDMAPVEAAFDAYAQALDDAGVFVTTQILGFPEAATTVTAVDGEPKIQDGPFADTKEYVGGVIVIDVPDLDAALAWAQKCPGASYGSVEVRPTTLTWSPERKWYQP